MAAHHKTPKSSPLLTGWYMALADSSAEEPTDWRPLDVHAEKGAKMAASLISRGSPQTHGWIVIGVFSSRAAATGSRPRVRRVAVRRVVPPGDKLPLWEPVT